MTTKEAFMNGLVAAFKEQIHTDVQIKPGDDGSAIPAHKAVLAVRSKVFRNMLDSDECKASPDDVITLSELTHDELECLLEFLYSGVLSTGKMKKHAAALFLAADKYEIPYLQELCRNHFLASLGSSNALDVLELSDIPSDKPLKDATLDFVVKHMGEIVALDDYEPFVQKNPHLIVQITRAYVKESKAAIKQAEPRGPNIW